MSLKTKLVRVGDTTFIVPSGIKLIGRRWLVSYGSSCASFAHHDDAKGALKRAIEHLVSLVRTQSPATGLHEKQKGVDPRLPVGITGPLLRKSGTTKEYACFSVCIPVRRGEVVYREVYIGTRTGWSDTLVKRKLTEAKKIRAKAVRKFKTTLKRDALLVIPELKELMKSL